MKYLKALFKGNIRQYGMILVMIVMAIFFHIATDGLLLTPLNLTNIILQNAYILIMICGMLPLILTGMFDMSVGSVAAVIGALAAILQVNMKVGFLPTLLLCLAVGAVIGAWQGFWVAYRGVPAFITTLSSQLVFRGLTILVLDGRSIGPFSTTFQAMSSSFVPDIFGGQGLHITTLLIAVLVCAWYVLSHLRARKTQIKYGIEVPPAWSESIKYVLICVVILVFSYLFASYQGFPTVLIIIAALILLYNFICQRSIIGRHLYAIGGNNRAAALSGVKTKLTVFITFINMGVVAALAGIVYAARLNAATPKAGNGFELDAIAACFVGGASVTGGSGTIAGAIVGGLMMGVLNNGMSMMGISIDIQQSVKGLVILFAVAFDIYSKSKQK